jgi:hypothetical protein
MGNECWRESNRFGEEVQMGRAVGPDTDSRGPLTKSGGRRCAKQVIAELPQTPLVEEACKGFPSTVAQGRLSLRSE